MKKLFFSTLTAMTLSMFAAPATASAANPLVESSKAPFETVPFNVITPQDYENAIMEGIRLQNQEISAITRQRSTPTFENTIAALDRSGKVLNKAVLALSNVEHAVGDTVLMNIMTKVTPVLSEHSAEIMLNEPLWQRVKEVYDRRDQRNDLTPEEQRLINETYQNFVESGASLEGKDRERYKTLVKELSDLTLRFAQNITNGMKAPERRLWVKADQLGGLPESIIAAARAEAKEMIEAEGKTDDGSMYVFTVFAPSYGPFIDRKSVV